MKPAMTPGSRVNPLEVRQAQVALGGRPVLHGVDLSVAAGEVVVILGPNGSGKSTLIRAALGLAPLSAGSVTLFGSPLGRFRHWERVGYVPQRVGAGSGVPATVREVVSAGRLARRPVLFPARARDRDAIMNALELVGLADRAGDPVSQLSGGQQQRVLIARALAGEPDLLIADEPTAGVDLESQQKLADVIADLIARGTAVAVVAHELGPLASVVQRAVILRDGAVVHDGTAPASVDDHDHGHTHPHEHTHHHEPAGPSSWLPTLS